MQTENADVPPCFVWPVRIYYENTDAGGVVYHCDYVAFLERARTEFLRSMAIELGALEKSHAVLFAIRSVQIDYLKPARLDDLLQVTVGFKALRSASIVFSQKILRQDDILCKAEVKVVAISSNTFRPTAVPEFMYERLDQVSKVGR